MYFISGARSLTAGTRGSQSKVNLINSAARASQFPNALVLRAYHRMRERGKEIERKGGREGERGREGGRDYRVFFYFNATQMKFCTQSPLQTDRNKNTEVKTRATGRSAYPLLYSSGRKIRSL